MITLNEFCTKVGLDGKAEDIDDLVERLRFNPPEYWRSPRYQLWKHTDGESGWDGTVTLVHRLGKNRAWIQRGHQERLLTAAAALQIDVEWGTRRRPFDGITIDDVPDDLLVGLTLDLDQRTCVAELMRSAHGTVEAATSSGKTAMALATVLMVRRRYPRARFLYVTPAERLVRQVVKESGKLAPSLRVSQFGGGVKSQTGKDLVIATQATLMRNHPRLVESGWYKTFAGLIYDECHHSAGEKSRKIVADIPALFRFGMSATLKNKLAKDKMKGLDIEGLFGPPRHVVSLAPLIEIGRVAKPRLYLVDQEEWTNKFEAMPYKVTPNTPAWCLLPDVGWVKGTYVGPVYQLDDDGEIVYDKKDDPCTIINHHVISIDGVEHEVESKWCLLHRQNDEGIIRFKERNALVVEWAKHFSSKGWPTLVVATRTLHVLILEALLTRAGLTEVRTLTGEDTSTKRDETFKWLINTPGAVLVSPLAKEGVSIPELKAGVVADYIAGNDLAKQIIGRFIRKKPEGSNEAHVVMFIDRQTAAMRRGSLGLIRELEKTRGYTFYWPCGGPSAIGAEYQAANFD